MSGDDTAPRVVIADDHTNRMANPAFERMFGFAPGTAVDTPLEDLLAQPAGVRRDQLYQQLLGKGGEAPGPASGKSLASASVFAFRSSAVGGS